MLFRKAQRANLGASAARLGRGFERRVLLAFQRNGFVQLRRNQWLRNYGLSADIASKREYDLVLFSPLDRQVYIMECKAHFDECTPVGLDLVREFHSKLTNYNGLHAVPVLVSDSDFTAPAREFAVQSRIYLLDKDGLLKLESSGSYFKKMKSRAYGAVFNAVENALDNAIREYL